MPEGLVEIDPVPPDCNTFKVLLEIFDQLALTLVDSVMVTLQVRFLPEQAPPHPAKV
jgi:hypothetical protein